MKECIKELAELALKAGLRPFIAQRGHYGFITDEQGSKVMCFGLDGLRLHFGGNYRAVNRSDAKYLGQGWRICDDKWPENKADIIHLFGLASSAPAWATRNLPVVLTTLERHLKDYQWSSQYAEYKGE